MYKTPTGGYGLLVQDLNSNGRIDGIDELFGSPPFTGFQELETLDTNTDQQHLEKPLNFEKLTNLLFLITILSYQ